MQGYFVNFIVNGDPNGHGLPHWPAAKVGGPVEVQHINVKTKTEVAAHEDRYLFMDKQ